MKSEESIIKSKFDKLLSKLVNFGGDEEDRTLDLTDANRTLSQLSYAPKYVCAVSVLVYIIAKIPICQEGFSKFFILF